MQRFEIADVLIDILWDKFFTYNRLTPFNTSIMTIPNLKIYIQNRKSIVKPKGELLIDEEIKWALQSEDNNKVVIYKLDKSTDKVLYMAEVDKKWEEATIYYLENVCKIEYEITNILGSILFRNSVLFHQGFVMHASSIEWNGKGIIFSAPSGTGKSTQAKLWNEGMGAKILNDDTPCVRRLNGQNYVYGTPWSGSSDIFINEKASISAIIILEQSKFNSIHRIGQQEAVSMLMPRCFLPYYDSEIMNMAINNFEKVISSTPVYLLKCRPDMEAVELVYQCVK